MVVLDEITYPLIYGWLPLEPVLRRCAHAPGRGTWCSPPPLPGREIIELADTVTEMQRSSMRLGAGIPAQRGH